MISLTTSIDTIIHLFDTSTVLYVENENHQILGQIKASNFMHALIQDNHQRGVMDTFAEMVKAGMKKIALAHPFKIKEERDSYIDYVEEISQNYGIHYYLDNDNNLYDFISSFIWKISKISSLISVGLFTMSDMKICLSLCANMVCKASNLSIPSLFRHTRWTFLRPA